MQNINSADIYDLIASLSQTEKTHFRKYANQHVKGGKNDYMRLFDVFDKQKKYNEQKINQAADGLKIRNISRAKNYLYDVILKALVSYHAGHSIDAEIRKDLAMVEVLWNRSFYESCRKMLARVRRTIIRFDRKIFLIELLDWESRLLTKSGTEVETFDKLLLNRQQALQNLSRCIAQVEYDFVGRSYSLSFRSTHDSLIKSNPVFVNSLQSYVLGLKESEVDQGDIKISYYMICILYHVSENRYHDAGQVANKVLDYLLAHEDHIISNLYRYVIVVCNGILLSCETHDFEQAMQYVDRLNHVEEQYGKYCSEELTQIIRTEVFIQTLNLLTLGGKKNDLQHFISASHLASDSPPWVFPDDAKEAIYCICISRAYFELGQFKQALQWLYKLVSQKRFESSYLYSNALVFEVIIHHELGHIELVESRIRSLKRYFKAKGNKYKLDILKIIEKLTKEQDTAKLLKALSGDLEKNHAILHNFAKFDIRRWLNAKGLSP